MKTKPPLQLTRAFRLRGTFLAVLAGCLAAGLASTHAAPPSLQPLLPGKWPARGRGSAFDVKVVGNYAYVALGAAGLAVIDVSTPTNCVRVGGYDTSGTAYGVAVSGNYAYVADYDLGLQVIDVSNPTNCVQVGGYDTSGRAIGVAVSRNYAYVANLDAAGLAVIDVSNPTNCVQVGGYNTGNTYGVAVSGNYAYVANDGAPGLAVIDVSNPTNCVRVGGCNTWETAWDVAVSGNYAYVSDHLGLEVIDVSDPTNCVRVGGYPTSGYAQGVAVSGNYAYVADFGPALQVIDVSDPTNCAGVGEYDSSGWAEGVAVVADRLYVAGGGGLLVVPTLPNVQFTVRVDATTNEPFTLEAATNLTAPIHWTCLLTTNVSAMPFDYVDFDVKLSEKRQKFYRVRQTFNGVWGTVVFRDDFDGSGSGPNPAAWVVNHPDSDWWVQGRTFFPSPVHHPSAPFPRLEAGKCIIEHHLFNAYDGAEPNITFLGGEIHTAMEFNPSNAHRFEARVRCNSYPNGLVTSFFTYGYDGSKSDEIDFEFLSKQSNDNGQWPAGDPVLLNPWNESAWNDPRECPQYLMVPSLDLTAWNTFRIYWYPGQRVDWTWLDRTCGEILLRTEANPCSQGLPDEPMSMYFNFWAPGAGWPAAYDPVLQPVNEPGQDQIHTYEIDYVEVRAP